MNSVHIHIHCLGIRIQALPFFCKLISQGMSLFYAKSTSENRTREVREVGTHHVGQVLH